MPWSTSSTRRCEPVVRSAQSRSCRSDSSSPSANRAALPFFLPPSKPGVASVGIAREVDRRRAGAGGDGRRSWAHHVGSSVDRPELVADHRERQPRAGSPCGPACPTSRRVAVVRVDAAQRPQLLADQRPGRRLLVGGVELVERRAGGLVVDALAPQLLGQGPAGQAAAALPALHPGPGEGVVVDQPDLGRTGRAAARRARAGTSRLASLSRSSWRLRAWPVSASSRILRATDSGSASGPAADGSGGGRSRSAAVSGIPRPRHRASSPARPASTGADARDVRSHRHRSARRTTAVGRRVDGRADAELLQDPLLELVGQVGVVA